MTTFREKIDKLLIINGKKITTIEGLESFAELGSKTLRRAYTENREPTPRTLGKLFSKFGINPEAWTEGEVEIFDKKHTSVGERALTYEATETNRDVVEVRVVEIKAQAGYLRGYADPEYMETLPTIPVNKQSVQGGHFQCFTVNGDSMDDGSKRSLSHGDVVLGRELYKNHWQNKLHFRKVLFIIIHATEGIVFKEIIGHDIESGEITCHSWNSQYEDFTLNLKDVKQIFYIKKIVERNINF